MSVIVAVIGWKYLVDFPDRLITKPAWGFLKVDEVEFALRRINKDRGDATAEPWNLRKWAASGLDWKVWGFALIYT